MTFISCGPSAEEKAQILKQKEDSTIKAITAITGTNVLHSEYDANGKEIIVAADNSTYTPVGSLTKISKKEILEFDAYGNETIIAADGSTSTPVPSKK